MQSLRWHWLPCSAWCCAPRSPAAPDAVPTAGRTLSRRLATTARAKRTRRKRRQRKRTAKPTPMSMKLRTQLLAPQKRSRMAIAAVRQLRRRTRTRPTLTSRTNPKATTRNPPNQKRSGLLNRDTGKLTTARSGCRMWYTRVILVSGPIMAAP